jgi:paraquat-inducible protein B
VGGVRSVKINDTLDGVVVKAILDEKAAQVATASTQFWVVKPELGLVKTANIGTLLTGEYITFRLGADSEPQFTFKGSTSPPLEKKESTGLNIVVKSPTLGSAKEGVAVSYRGIQVGKVTGSRLADTADHVRIYINIEKKFVPLIKTNTRFWNSSGLDIGFKLFGGARIKTESLESILAGGISFATPNNDEMGEQAQEGDEFMLFADRDDKWLTWQPKIELEE